MKILIKNTYALVPDGDRLKISQTNICVSGDKILSVGDIPEDFVPRKTFDGSGYLTMPGLINCHTHSYMSVFRNLADDLSFEDWLFKSISPREDRLTDEDAYWGSMLSCAEMIKTGTTCFMDMHMFRNMCAKAADVTGMRAFMTRGLVGSDRNDEGGIRRINDTLEEMKNYGDNSRFGFMFAPHAIYTCGDDYLRFCIEKAKEYKLPLHIHLSETVGEVENCRKAHNGMTPTEYLDDMGFFEVKTCAAHCVHLTENDMKILRDKKVNVIHNPKSNLKLGNGIAPIWKLDEMGVNVCMGTDSQASNNTLNMFSEMNFAALIHKGVNRQAQAVGAQDVLRFALKNGADALGINTGSLEAGKLADIIMLDLDVPEFYPQSDMLSSLVYSANGTEVRNVIINGEIVLENGKLTNADEEEIYHNAQKVIERLNKEI